MFLTSLTAVFLGWMFSQNLSVYSLMEISFQGWYWLIMITGLMLFFFSSYHDVLMSTGFWSQGKSLDFLFVETLLPLKKMASSYNNFI